MTAGTRDERDTQAREQPGSTYRVATSLSLTYLCLIHPVLKDGLNPYNVLAGTKFCLLALLHHLPASHTEIEVHVQAAAPAEVIQPSNTPPCHCTRRSRCILRAMRDGAPRHRPVVTTRSTTMARSHSDQLSSTCIRAEPTRDIHGSAEAMSRPHFTTCCDVERRRREMGIP
jgi:hypothetical protein